MALCSYPHGKLITVMLAIALTIAQLITDVANASCQIFYSTKLNTRFGFLGVFTPNRVDTNINGFNQFHNINYWRYCDLYSNIQRQDFGGRLLLTSRIFALIAVGISLFVTILVWTLCCCGWHRMFTRFAAFALAMASLSQGLSFLVTRSELCSQGCHLTWGGALSIVSIGLLFALSIAMLQIPGIEQIEASEQQEKDASTVKTLSPAVEAINPSRNAEDIDTEKAVTINAMTEDGTPIRILAGKP